MNIEIFIDYDLWERREDGVSIVNNIKVYIRGRGKKKRGVGVPHTTIEPLGFEPQVTPPTLFFNRILDGQKKPWGMYGWKNISTQIKNYRGEDKTNLFPSALFSFFQLIATLLSSDHLLAYLSTMKPSVSHDLKNIPM